MEFDKNKILTVVTADQAKVGQKGWFADVLDILRELKKNRPVFSNVYCCLETEDIYS